MRRSKKTRPVYILKVQMLHILIPVSKLSEWPGVNIKKDFQNIKKKYLGCFLVWFRVGKYLPPLSVLHVPLKSLNFLGLTGDGRDGWEMEWEKGGVTKGSKVVGEEMDWRKKKG